MCVRWALTLLLVADFGGMQVARAGEVPLFLGQQKRLWVAPDHVFALELPSRWVVFVADQDPNTIELRPEDTSIDASLFIRHLKVPAGASPRQLLLNALEERLRPLPSFREGPRRDVIVSGSPGAVVSGTYYYQGNAQYPRAVEEVFVVRGEEAFIFHFDCFAPLAPRLGSAIDGVYKSFTLTPSGKGDDVAPSRSPFAEPTKLPTRVRF